MDAVVFGNVTLDVLCYPVEEVPRHDSLTFERSALGPGGCGSNVAVGLSMLGVPTGLVACLGSDEGAALVRSVWAGAGVDQRLVRQVPGPTAVSVGLVDRTAQPRFVHTPNANAGLTVDAIDVDGLIRAGVRAFHVGGFFVLPGLLDGARLGTALQALSAAPMLTALDVVHSPRMDDPAPLWPCLPHLDIFLCNRREGRRITGEDDPAQIAAALRARGANAVVIKLGDQGCWLSTDKRDERIPAPQIEVIDTTGAGDAFAAGLLAALLEGRDLPDACRAGNAAGARIAQHLGAVAGWFAEAEPPQA